MPVINHIHTYVKYKRKPGFFRCEAQDCTHSIDRELIIGKLNLCSMCGKQMILTREDLRRARPRCIECSETKKAKLHKKAMQLTKLLGTAAFDPLELNSKQPSFPSLTESNLEDELEEETDEDEEEEDEE